jgi:hypothetical protein
MRGTPVTDNVALKAKFAFEDSIKELGVLAAICLINSVAVL